MIIGVNGHPLWTSVAPSTWFTPWAQAMAPASMLRFDVNWQSYSAPFITDLLGVLGPLNITPLLMLGSGGANWSAPDPFAYATTAAAIAKLLPAGAFLEVWNEPNCVPNFMPTKDPVGYAHLVWTTTMLVRQANPQVKVVAGVVLYDDATYLNAFLGASPVPPFDILSIHPYSAPSLPPDQVAQNAFESTEAALKMAKATGLPFMASEIGFLNTSGNPLAYDAAVDAVAASYYRAAVQMAQAAGALALCGYHLGDRQNSGAGVNMALMDANHVPHTSWFGLTSQLQ